MSASNNQIYLAICQGQESLGSELANLLGIKIISRNFEKFSSGEILLDPIEDPQDKDTYILTTPLYPGHDGYMELFLMLDAVRRHGARKIIPIIPYFGYGRQNRCFKPYSPMPCELLAKLLRTAGATEIITVDLHDPGVVSFFAIPVQSLSFSTLIAQDIQVNFREDVVIVSPDAGGIKRAQEVANLIQSPVVTVSKKRLDPKDIKILGLEGSVEGKTAIIIDDLVDSGNTICRCADLLIEKKAKSVYAYVTHGLLSKQGFEKIQESSIATLTLSNSVPSLSNREEKIRYISLGSLLAEAIFN